MAEFAIEIQNVSKTYGATTKALDELSFSIPKGVICGVVGANGAGKTTLYSVIAGYLPFDSGMISILGKGPFDIEEHQGKVSILPQDAELIPEMSIRQLLEYYARLQGIYGYKTEREVVRVLKNVDLIDKWETETKISQLSHGMRRRVSVAQALLGEPELILLDEPSAGLDPIQTANLRHIFMNKSPNTTMLISSHILSELEEVCDYIVFMDKGKCTQHGFLSDLMGQTSTVRIRFAGNIDMVHLQKEIPHMQFQIEKDNLICTQDVHNNIAQINALVLPYLLHHRIEIFEIQAGYRLSEHYERRTGEQGV